MYLLILPVHSMNSPIQFLSLFTRHCSRSAPRSHVLVVEPALVDGVKRGRGECCIDLRGWHFVVNYYVYIFSHNQKPTRIIFGYWVSWWWFVLSKGTIGIVAAKKYEALTRTPNGKVCGPMCRHRWDLKICQRVWSDSSSSSRRVSISIFFVFGATAIYILSP